MQHHIRLMHIHLHLRKRIQQHASHFPIDRHGIQRIIFSCSSCIHFKGQMLVLINLIHILHQSTAQLIKPFILHLHHGTDIRNAEHLLQMFHRLIIIILLRQHIHINPSPGTMNRKLPLAPLQRIPNLPHKSILKNPPVLPFHTDFRIFN